MLGTEGVSNTFMLGAIVIEKPEAFNQQLSELREEILANPYFKNVPSMDPAKGKTALFFHAKDDLPEIRMKVFELLSATDFKAIIAVRRKMEMIVTAEARFKESGQKLLSPNEIYDDLVKRVFKLQLKKDKENHLVFAQRTKSDRTKSLKRAIERAKANMESSWDRVIEFSTPVICSTPNNYAGLQLVDYCLWAVQRLYERQEDRYFNFMSEKYSLIMDLDDKRNKGYGEWYRRDKKTNKNTLSLQNFKPING